MSVALATCCVISTSANEVLSLNSYDGTHWQVFPAEGLMWGRVVRADFQPEDYVEGIVPGTVFGTYVAAGREEDPNWGDNVYRVDESKYNQTFWYRTQFDRPELAEGQHAILVFEGINRYATVYLNGRLLSRSRIKGHVMKVRYDITSYLSDQNTLAVKIDMPASNHIARTDNFVNYVVPTYVASHSWDWMPYVPGLNCGITNDVFIEKAGEVTLRDPWVHTTALMANNKMAHLNLQTSLTNLTETSSEVEVQATILPGDIKTTKTVTLQAGDSIDIAFDNISISNPRLWWPNGTGDQNLYTCQFDVVKDGKTIDTQTVTFGIKKYEYRIEKNSVDFPVLTLYINGQRIFLKGGNWGMSEYLLRMHGQQYELPIRLHKEMNYNMIRLWTGCVTDDEFYDYCDQYGMLVWNDFWLYVAWNDVAEHDAFKVNARDKVRRLRNHPSIAVWCGANETRPVADIDQALRMIVMEEDGNDRLYTSCSNQDAKSGSGWWKDMPPRHHFETSASNLAFNKPAYPYGIDYGYGFRSEIGMATFPTFESVREFIPQKDWWPLPTDEQLEKDDDTVWNRHFFGKEAWNGGPIDYKKSVNDRYGESKSLEDFCEKAQLINLEDMKGMYEAWNDKMWNDASALLIWMSHPAYPSFVWQTYDYYYDPTGCYWGARQACEPQHVQWNCLTNSVKVINATSQPLRRARAEVRVYDINGQEVPELRQQATVDVEASNITEAFVIDFSKASSLSPIHFLRLSLTAGSRLLSENFYWRNGEDDLDYRGLLTLPEAKLKAEVARLEKATGRMTVTLTNNSKTVAFANRLRLVNAKTGARILPAIMSDGYVTLLPGEQRTIGIEAPADQLTEGVKLLVKQFGHKERVACKF